MSDHGDPSGDPGGQGNPLRLADQLCFALYAASHAMTRAYRPLLDALGLTYPQYLVMLVLWEGDDLGVKAAGERLGLDSGTLTPLLKRLEAQGLIERSRDRGDERSVRVRLTAAGAGLRDRALALPARILARSGCSAAELAALQSQLNALRTALAAGGRPGTHF
jgi:DNA-binding MarR family transcriptional regulator